METVVTKTDDGLFTLRAYGDNGFLEDIGSWATAAEACAARAGAALGYLRGVSDGTRAATAELKEAIDGREL